MVSNRDSFELSRGESEEQGIEREIIHEENSSAISVFPLTTIKNQ